MPLAVADTGRTNSTSSTSILFFNSSILEFLNSKRSSYLSIRSVLPKRNTSEWMMLLVNASRTAFWCGVSSSRFQVTTKQRNLIANAVCSQLGKSYKTVDFVPVALFITPHSLPPSAFAYSLLPIADKESFLLHDPEARYGSG